ncbi:MAG: hypothetical protein AAGF85_05395, partial [Bacteroidota bacterium]
VFRKRVLIVALVFFSGLIISCSDQDEIVPQNDSVESEALKGNPEKSSRTNIRVENGVTCTDRNPRLYNFDYINPNGTDVNRSFDAQIDDRTCVYNYSQISEGGRWKGIYKIKAGSNHIDDLQPRIERASSVLNNTRSGNYVRFTGYVTIKRVGHVSDNWPQGDMRDASGTYLCQSKGKHTGGGGSADPAIALLIAKPVFSGGNQVSYNIYREQIKFRGGSGVNGRELVYLTNIPANTRRFIRMENGFKTVNGSKRHYVNVRIGGTDYNWNVPDPQRATQAKIRMGAYRCKGGEAEILWDTVSERIVNN